MKDEETYASLVSNIRILDAENDRIARHHGEYVASGADHDTEVAYCRADKEDYGFRDVVIDAARQIELEYATYAACEAIVSLEERVGRYEKLYGLIGPSVPDLLVRVRAVARGEPSNQADHQKAL